MTDKARYIASVKIEKVTPAVKAVGFTSESPQEAGREELANVRVSGGDLESLKLKVGEHLDLVQE
jgi:hypothetical protein